MQHLLKISSCGLLIFSWLQDHLIPCPFKYLTGIDCPGCGFQRAVLALAKGNLQQSWALYPPAIPVLLFVVYGLVNRFVRLDTKKETITKACFVMVGAFILCSYTIKMLHIHHTISA